LLAGQADDPHTPKFVLAIVVDRFRYDYLLRFRDGYNSGLQRLLEQGAVFTDAHYLHAATVTAVGIPHS
jgi:arylsulfatase A-like enzyme